MLGSYDFNYLKVLDVGDAIDDSLLLLLSSCAREDDDGELLIHDKAPLVVLVVNVFILPKNRLVILQLAELLEIKDHVRREMFW